MKFRFWSRTTAFVHDMLMVPAAWLGAYFMRFNLEWIPDPYLGVALFMLPVVVLVQVSVFWWFGLYRGVWRFASIPDVVRIIKSVVVGTSLLAVALFLLTRMQDIPRSVLPLYAFLLVFMLSGPRLLYRYRKDHRLYARSGKAVLIVGAGGAGEVLARELLRDPETGYQPVGFVDDDPAKQGREVHGLRVLGSCDELPVLVPEHAVRMLFIALPTAKAAQMQRVVHLCEATGVEFRTLPPIQDMFSARSSLESLREVSIEDLLGREPVALDWQRIGAGVNGRCVMVTGGGGSIGSELCRQIARLGPAQLIVVDNSEFNLFSIERELIESFEHLRLDVRLGDICDAASMDALMVRFAPSVVFHAAAYKHVPMLQYQLREAVRNNVLGTRNVISACARNQVDTCVLISTDKAVNPTNIMGTTKRVAEILCQCMNERSATRFITVRFGNVLDSAGSVVPLFRRQIEHGGPVTVTHPDIKRYFMTIPEACQLILQASTVGNGGEIYVLDMGEPVRIQFLAEQMIMLSGKKVGDDIEITYIGLRPGEKLFEELFHPDEQLRRTPHEKLFLARHRAVDEPSLDRTLAELERACEDFDEKRLRELLASLVPEASSAPEALDDDSGD